ncbi:WhiB family transcriptional regulator [Pseudonocardia acaciae]|uniref:WhiB family transcriptional regulator n=1 Tax=Pseudonocardia acaciae TaxID=551276 RepID=UPI0006858A6F|nr:WhiB family transcriptional regulator [Pseudonocardia acaciae]
MNAAGNWRVSANCRNGDPDRLFVTGAKQRDARSVCRGCPVLTQCLAHALDERIEFGVWGGMTERERRAMLRRRPEVTAWEPLLRAAARRARLDAVAARADAARAATTTTSEVAALATKAA